MCSRSLDGKYRSLLADEHVQLVKAASEQKMCACFQRTVHPQQGRPLNWPLGSIVTARAQHIFDIQLEQVTRTHAIQRRSTDHFRQIKAFLNWVEDTLAKMSGWIDVWPSTQCTPNTLVSKVNWTWAVRGLHMGQTMDGGGCCCPQQFKAYLSKLNERDYIKLGVICRR